jgi:hypothetical protein
LYWSWMAGTEQGRPEHRHEDGGARAGDWLPAPKNGFVLMARMYWPKEPVLDGSWKIPPVEAVVRSGSSTR